jgi:thioredoxin 1
MIRQVTDEGFEDLIARERGVMAVAFMAYCSVPCDHFKPELSALPDLLRGKVKFYQIDSEENPSISDVEKILAVPTLVIYREGIEIARYEGVYTKECLKDRIETLLIQKKPGAPH